VVAIIILTFNGVRANILQDCLESVRQCTHVPYTIYLVEQGSTDNTLRWLDKYQRHHPIPLKVIPLTTNVGFPKGCNRAFKQLANEEQVCLLNNDTIVSPYWLTRLSSYLSESRPIVGPSTNYAAQQYLKVYKEQPVDVTMNQVADRARWVYKNFKEQTRTFRHLSGFCMLFYKYLLDEVGVFDERFKLGSGEEADFCWRVITSEASKVDRKCLWVKEVYVHHKHAVTFKMLGIDYAQYKRETGKILREKWAEKGIPQ